MIRPMVNRRLTRSSPDQPNQAHTATRSAPLDANSIFSRQRYVLSETSPTVSHGDSLTMIGPSFMSLPDGRLGNTSILRASWLSSTSLGVILTSEAELPC